MQVDEDEDGGLRALTQILLSYGERHFDGVPKQQGSRRGVWAGVLLMCGQFERVCRPPILLVLLLTILTGRDGAVGASRHGSGSRTSCYRPCILWFTSRPVACGDVRYDTTYELLLASFNARLISIKVSLSPLSPPALSLPTLIWRYVRQFVKTDTKEALQYVYCVCLAANQGDGVGKEQVENAWELVRRIIILGNSGSGWEELVGGFRPDGSRFVSPCIYHRWLMHLFTLVQSGIIEQGATLLQLKDSKQFNEQILVRAAKHSEENDRISEAIKLYNLAEDYPTVISCLAQSLGNTITQPSPDEKARAIEKTATEILRHYERMNRAVGKDRDAVIRLLRIREAMEAKSAGRPEIALDVGSSLVVENRSLILYAQVMESTDLIPLSGDVAKITRRAEEFKDLHESLQRNLQIYLPLTMDSLVGVHQRVKGSIIADATRQMVNDFHSILNDSYAIVVSDACDGEKEVEVTHDLCWDAEVPHVARHLFIPCSAGCRNRAVILRIILFPSFCSRPMATLENSTLEIPLTDFVPYVKTLVQM